MKLRIVCSVTSKEKKILFFLVYHDFSFDLVHEDPKIDDDHSILDKYSLSGKMQCWSLSSVLVAERKYFFSQIWVFVLKIKQRCIISYGDSCCCPAVLYL